MAQRTQDRLGWGDSARMLFRFQAGLGRYFETRIAPGEAADRLAAFAARREKSFLTLVQYGIFARPASPWARLFRSAGIEFGDVEALVERRGLESALAQLYDAGIYLTIGEAKGKQPIVRNGLEIPTTATDFDNPLLSAAFASYSSGSSGARRRHLIDFGLLDHDSYAHAFFLENFDLWTRPMAVWRPAPPGSAGLKRALIHLRSSAQERWFSQTDPRLGRLPLKSWALLKAAEWGARAQGVPFPRIEYAPLTQAKRVAEWLATHKRNGTPAYLETIVSSGIRTCQAAVEEGLDIAGSFVRVGGESLTPSRVAAFQAAGVEASCHYSMSETGTVAVACADVRSGAAPTGDTHVLLGKASFLAKPRADGSSALYLTGLLPVMPRLMINVETGDSGYLETRDCGCPAGGIGYRQHIHTIRSYEKVSSEGMYFLGADLALLVEEVLPAKFGGAPTDYQFVHQELGGLNRVRLLAAPWLGDLPEERLRDEVLNYLSRGVSGDAMKVKLWREAGGLVVERKPPEATAAQKVLPVRFVRD